MRVFQLKSNRKHLRGFCARNSGSQRSRSAASPPTLHLIFTCIETFTSTTRPYARGQKAIKKFSSETTMSENNSCCNDGSLLRRRRTLEENSGESAGDKIWKSLVDEVNSLWDIRISSFTLCEEFELCCSCVCKNSLCSDFRVLYAQSELLS